MAAISSPGFSPCGFAVEQSALKSFRFVPVRDDFQTAEFLTADNADYADKGRTSSDYPRHLRNPRLRALAGALVAAPIRGAKPSG
jgi:hypothetical protein